MPINGTIVHRFGRAVLIRPPMLRAGPGLVPHYVDADPAPGLLAIASQLRADLGLDAAVIAIGGPGAVLCPRIPRQWERVLNAFAGLNITTFAAIEGCLSSAESVLAAVLDFRVATRSAVFNGFCTGPQASCLHPRLADMCAKARAAGLSPHAPVPAIAAHEAEMVDVITEPERAHDEALRWAQRTVGWPHGARTLAKLAINAQAIRRAGPPHAAPGCLTAGCALR